MKQTPKNIGNVLSIKDGIVVASGLSQVGYNEVVVIRTEKDKNIRGLAFDLSEETVGIVVLNDASSIKEGDEIEVTGKELHITVSDELLGHVITPLGEDLEKSGEQVVKKGTDMPLERIAPGIIDRKNITNEHPLATGILAVDALIPIGRGQRELIIGDRQTGKTALCIDTILNQKNKDLICVYVAIGQKASKIAQLKAKLAEAGALEYTVIVAAPASAPASQQYIAPYAGCAIAEYYAEQGKHALVIYDDLTKHAWAYREISLLLKRPPGREAYPGDIFYLHSRLLERAVQFSDEKGAGSITALPIVETQAGDVSAYIPTNIISITDGQIYLETDLFNAGQRPALNIGLSVSRVGSTAQVKAMKKVAGPLKLNFAQFRELQVFAQFGSDLDDTTKQQLRKGEKIAELLKQQQYLHYSISEQVMMIYAVTNDITENVSLEQLAAWKVALLADLKKNNPKVLKELNEKKEITPEIETAMKDYLVKMTTEFTKQ